MGTRFPAEGIYLEMTPALPWDDAKKDHGVYYHAYLVYRDGKGGEEVLRAGPESKLGWLTGDDIEVQKGKLSDSKDAYKKASPGNRVSQ